MSERAAASAPHRRTDHAARRGTGWASRQTEIGAPNLTRRVAVSADQNPVTDGDRIQVGLLRDRPLGTAGRTGVSQTLVIPDAQM